MNQRLSSNRQLSAGEVGRGYGTSNSIVVFARSKGSNEKNCSYVVPLADSDAAADRSVSPGSVAKPLTTGMFIRMAAEAAEEDARRRKKRITPYWRTVKGDGRLNDKFPGGAKNHARRLRAEGFILDAGRGASPPKVRNFKADLVRL